MNSWFEQNTYIPIHGLINFIDTKHDWLYLLSVNSDEQLPQSPFTGKFFLMTTFYFGVYKAN